MTLFSIRHVTRYDYAAPVAFGEHRVQFRPRPGFDQSVRFADLAVEPRPASVTMGEDAAGNIVDTVRFGFERRDRRLVFTTRVEVEVEPTGPVEPRIAEHARVSPFTYGADTAPDLARFIERQQPDPDHAVDRWARRIMAEDGERGTWSFLCRLNAAIRRDFAYVRRDEKGVQEAITTLRLGRGSCRDFAVLMAEAARSQGLAARFVSGYLRVHDHDPVSRLAGGSTHAWVQVFLPGAGWIDFDPTSGTVGNDDLIRVAAVRDPDAATPLSGSFIGFPSDFTGMSVAVEVSIVDGSAQNFIGAEPTHPASHYLNTA